jgi:PKHD-type hydroxylase
VATEVAAAAVEAAVAVAVTDAAPAREAGRIRSSEGVQAGAPTIIPDILSPEELEHVLGLLAEEPDYADGSDVAGYRAGRRKHGDQLRLDHPVNQEIGRIVLDALDRNRRFDRIAMPKQALAPFVARYGPGKALGTHLDEPLARRGLIRVRKDIAVSLFLSDPASYDGGELVVETPWGEHAMKGPLNSAAVYPADRLHRVNKVTRGERITVVTWIESHVRDAGQREVLADMLAVAEHLHGIDPDARVTDIAYKCWSDLMRRWVET